jgi:hypothetical protein
MMAMKVSPFLAVVVVLLLPLTIVPPCVVSSFQLGGVLSKFIPNRNPQVTTPQDGDDGSRIENMNHNNNNNNQKKNKKNIEIESTKRQLLSTISNTNNGKKGSLATQTSVLRLVNYLEKNAPASTTLLTNPIEATAIDGVWYLQYTQPSEIATAAPPGDSVSSTESDDIDINDDDDDDVSVGDIPIPVWVPQRSTVESVMKIDTQRVNNMGTVTFLGTIPVDASNRKTTQTINCTSSTISNYVEQDFGTVVVRGSYVLDSVPNRVIVSFDTCIITFKTGWIVDLSFLFTIRTFLKGGETAGGWLETTYLDSDVRIGRGNRGSLFILTRDPDAVTP